MARKQRRPGDRTSIWVQRKAELIVEGEVHVRKGTPLPVFPIRSSGGPTSSRPHLILGFGPNGTRVKVAMTDRPARFELRRSEDGSDEFVLLDKGKIFQDHVRVIPAVMHAPEQAFINIEPTCDRGCLFCSADTERDLGWSADRWIKAILDKHKKEPFSAVAITAGVPHGTQAMVDLMSDIIAGVRYVLPTVDIGVEPNAISREALEMLRAAGADELKVNVQTATERLFKKVCPRLDREDIFRCLKDGLEVFGPGNVASNIIIGLGETDKEVLECVKKLSSIGVVANIRALRVNDANVRKLEKALGKKVGVKDPRRLLDLLEKQAAIFKKYDLDPRVFRTMCHRCTCCDLTAGWDF